jgi:hypothetical protein
MKRIAITVEVEDEVDIFTLHESLLDRFPEFEETLITYESIEALIKDQAPKIKRVDKYTISVDGVSISATPEIEAKVRAMTREQVERFVTIMGGER